MKMTTKQKQTYRAMAGAGLLVLAFFALAPTWNATADQSAGSNDECCDLATGTIERPAVQQVASSDQQQNDVYGIDERISDYYRGAVASNTEHSGLGAPEFDPASTFADNQPGPTEPLAEHDDTYRPSFRWSSADNTPFSRGIASRNTGKPQVGPDATIGAPDPTDPEDPTDPDDPTNPDDPTDPKDPTNPDTPVVTVPEPPAIALLIIGLLGVVVLRRRAQ